jgi:V/A-type H+-transporting ATPase subunit I
LAIEKMKLVRVYGLLDHLDEFITSCCISGDFHPENAMNYLSDTLGFVQLNEENPYNASIQKLEELAGIAGVTLKEEFSGNEIIIDNTEKDFVDELRTHLEETLAARKQLVERIQVVNSSIEQFSHFTNLDIPLNDIFSSGFLKVRFGCIPRDCYPKLKAYEDNENILFVECKQDEKNYWGLYTAPETKIDEVDRIFASLYFERIRIPDGTGTPEQMIEDLSDELTHLTAQLEVLDKEISNYWSDNSEHCELIYAHLKIVSLAYDLRHYAAKDENSVYYTYVGWVPESSMKWFKHRIKKIADTAFEEYEPSEDTRNAPPVKLRNRKPFRPFEMFVEMYGLPSYDGLDITPFVAVTYTLLFGIMFADVGQGLVLALGGYLLYKFKGNRLAKIMVPCGVCSMIFGFLFGSVFGYEELLNPLYKAMGLSGKPVSVMDSINTILLFSIGIGIALVIISMGLNVFCCIKDKKIGEALFSQNGLTGIILYSVLVCAVISFMGGATIIPGTVILIVSIICLVILYFKDVLIARVDHRDDLMPEKWSDYIMQNFFEVIEYILTYFSNTVSFLRVGAFVLVHAGMMMVFASLAGNEYSVGGIISMIFGNVLVISLEGLLTGIQVLRLEFYEMFSRFYEGDGKPFQSVGKRKNRGFLFKTKGAFNSEDDVSENDSDENVIITANK